MLKDLRQHLCGIYFVQSKTLGLIKIGLTEDIDTRLRGLATTSPDKLKLLAIIVCQHDDLSSVELALHVVCEASRSHGEWFHPTAQVMACVHAVAPDCELEVRKLQRRCLDNPPGRRADVEDHLKGINIVGYGPRNRAITIHRCHLSTDSVPESYT